MRLKNIKILMLILITFSVNACKCNQTQRPNGDKPVYVYTFEKGAPITMDDSKKMITEYLGIADVHDLTVNKDENIAYFVSDSDVNTTFEQDLTNGNFAFSKLNKDYMGGLTPQLPAKEEAEKIAESFMASKNIAPKDKGEMRLVHSGGVRSQAVVNGRQGGPVVDKLITLTYGRVIDSLPVIGAGSKMVINIGDKGEVYGMIRRWREVNKSGRKEVKPAEMITSKEAEEIAKKQIASEFGSNTNFEITRTTKSYYDGNGNILQPVWAFEATINLDRQDKNTKPVKYLSIISMLKNSPEPIRLQTLDPKAKELIKTVQASRDTTGSNNRDKQSND